MTENSEFLSRIRDLAEPVARREGCEIYDLEWVSGHRGKGRLLRVYIDKEGGVTLDDCTNVSRGLNLILDVEDAIPGSAYSLEVSSPGLERNLREHKHFQLALGQKVSVKLKQTKDNLKYFQGVLTESTPEHIVVEIDQKKVVSVRLDEIQKARTVFENQTNFPKGGKKKSEKVRGAHGR